MIQKPARDRRHVEVMPLPAIMLSGSGADRPGQTRWGLILVWYMRLVACLWLFDGLSQWSAILGVFDKTIDAFDALPDPLRVTIAFFAVIDLLAAIGLWLTAAWGGVVWILATAAQVALPFLVTGYSGGGIVIQALYGVLILIYFIITWLAARERETA